MYISSKAYKTIKKYFFSYRKATFNLCETPIVSQKSFIAHSHTHTQAAIQLIYDFKIYITYKMLIFKTLNGFTTKRKNVTEIVFIPAVFIIMDF